jgi:serine protease DegQ
MRPVSLFACLLLAAVGGGVTARFLTHQPSEPPPQEATADLLADATTLVVPEAQAALPAQVGGAPLPSLAPMLEKVTPAVVNIYTKQVVRTRPSLISEMMGFPRQRVQQSLGSGVVVDATRGLILTNNHVVEGADQVSVTLSDGRTFEAKPIGFDADTDVAVIQIDATDLTALPLADSGSLRVGDFVVAVGNPYGLGQAVTSGIVSAVGRSGLTGLGYQNFIQTDASINPGNSGGALVNLRGELVGINAASFNPQGSAAGNIGLGFAIPSNLAREVMRQLMAYGEVRRGSLGVASQNAEEGRGAQITRVYRGSPAEAAGIVPGDVIVSANGERIDSAEALHNLEGLLPVGQPVRVELLRDGDRRTVDAVLKAVPRDVEGATLDARLAGATFADVPERSRQQGVRAVMVSRVADGSRAARNGLASGDLVLAINRREVGDLNEFRAQLGGKPAALALYVVRGRRRGELEMR